jgi:exonuclease VII large subunit
LSSSKFLTDQVTPAKAGSARSFSISAGQFNRYGALDVMIVGRGGGSGSTR